jgi:hypothetical protein
VEDTGRFAIPVFVKFREPAGEFIVGFGALKIATKIADVRGEVSPLLRVARTGRIF